MGDQAYEALMIRGAPVTGIALVGVALNHTSDPEDVLWSVVFAGKDAAGSDRILLVVATREQLVAMCEDLRDTLLGRSRAVPVLTTPLTKEEEA